MTDGSAGMKRRRVSRWCMVLLAFPVLLGARCAADDPVPLREDGAIDTKRVKEIEIIEIRDTH